MGELAGQTGVVRYVGPYKHKRGGKTRVGLALHGPGALSVSLCAMRSTEIDNSARLVVFSLCISGALFQTVTTMGCTKGSAISTALAGTVSS